MAENKLGRCSEHLRKAVVYMAVSPAMPKDKLRAMAEKTGFGSIAAADFPAGPMRDEFQVLTGKLSTPTEPQWVVNIDAMSDDEARKVIEQICDLSDDVSRALGGEK
jgi:hypothetical protein